MYFYTGKWMDVTGQVWTCLHVEEVDNRWDLIHTTMGYEVI